MTWDTYYDRFYDWADSTRITNISKLEDFGPSDQVCEIVQELSNEAAATRLVRKALAAGVRFTAEEVADMEFCLKETLIPDLARTASTPFTEEQFDNLSFSLSAGDRSAIARKSGLLLDDDDEPEEDFWAYLPKPPARKRARGSLLAILLSLFDGGKTDSHRCDGDCSNCPPHYGYRYGRWYYGHGHQYGCQRGGNGGACGKCLRD